MDTELLDPVGASGFSSFPFLVDLPPNADLHEVIFDDVYRVYWGLGGTVHVVEVDEGQPSDETVLNGVGFLAIAAGTLDSYVWEQEGRIVYEQTSGDPTGNGRFVTQSFPPEVVRNSAEDEDRVARRAVTRHQ